MLHDYASVFFASSEGTSAVEVGGFGPLISVTVGGTSSVGDHGCLSER